MISVVWWLSLLLVSVSAASLTEEGNQLDSTFGEIFASWSVLIILALLIVALHYFERVRQPPVPILEQYTKHIALPPHWVAKMDEMTSKSKVAVYTWAIDLPYVGKWLKGSGDMQPLKHDTRMEKVFNSPRQEEDYRDMIIGAPLDEGMSSPGVSPRTSPKSPPLVVIKTMIEDKES